LSDSELPGENSPKLTRQSGLRHKRKPGRPSEIDPESLRRAVNELQFVLEENWGVVGWLLREAKTLPDVRTAFGIVVIQRCRYLEPFTDDRTLRSSPKELRALRKRVTESQMRLKADFNALQYARESCEQAFNALVAESDPLRRAQVQTIRPDLASKYQKTELLEKASRRAMESLEAGLKEREAFFAQSEILKFVQANRRKHTPLNMARAMAGLPLVTSRVSFEQCQHYQINSKDGIQFRQFQSIQKVLREPIRDLSDSIEAMRKHLLSGPGNDSPDAAALRKNWYFLESAIRSAARDTHAPQGSVAFRTFAEYTKNSTSHTAAEAVLATAYRLFRDGEDPEKDRVRFGVRRPKGVVDVGQIPWTS